MWAVHPIGFIHPKRRRWQRAQLPLAVGKKLLVPLVMICTIMLAVFFPNEVDSTEQIVMSVTASPQTAQSAAYMQYTKTATERDVNDGSPTVPTSPTEAYVDAEGHVAAYNASLVKTSEGLTVGTNSPTREYDAAHAYVVNVQALLEEELQDIITFEQQTLGLTGHKSATEYAKEKLPIEKSITSHYGKGSRNMWYGAVGPAVNIRNFYQDQRYTGYATGASEYFGCFGGADNAYLDAMLVKNEDVDAYFSGQDVPVIYAQFRMFAGNAKAHCAPWGITQTYFQMNRGGTMQPNTSMGGFTPGNLGTVPATGNASADMANLLDMAKQYINMGKSIYWWPTILASSQDLGITTTSFSRVTSGTANIFESFSNQAYRSLQKEYAGYSLVGILVYAIQ